MVFEWRHGATGWLVGAILVWAAPSACSSSSSSGAELPPRGEAATDPGCRVIGEGAPAPGGRSVDVVHETIAADASTDGGADASEPNDGGAGGDAAPEASASSTPDVAITAEAVRTLACREGTTLDVAAGEGGGLFVAGGGVRAQVVTFSAAPPSTRVVDYLQAKGASVRIATLADGRPLLVATPNEKGELVTEEGTGGPRLAGAPSSARVLGRAVTNAAGAILVTTSNEGGLLRTAGGDQHEVALPKVPSSGLGTVRTVVGLGNDDRPFRIAAEGTADVRLADRSVAIDGIGSVRGVAFTTVAVSEPLPLVAIAHGDSRDPALNALDVAIPAGDAYVRVRIASAPTPCRPEPQCANMCTEENQEVDPKEIAAAWDGSRAYVVFVRRSATRTRRYKTTQGSGIICDVFGCDPSCATESSAVTSSADLVIATVDVPTRTVREVFRQPLEVVNGSTTPSSLWSGGPARTELAAHARDGYLHVAFAGTYQGSFPAVAVFRFRVAP